VRIDIVQTGADPGQASAGQDVTFQQSIAATAEISVLSDYELWDDHGQKVWQMWHDNLALQPGSVFVDSMILTVPADFPTGRYRFACGVFSAGWGTEYAWNPSAGALDVLPASSP
jgi:hypothetical protein